MSFNFLLFSTLNKCLVIKKGKYNTRGLIRTGLSHPQPFGHNSRKKFSSFFNLLIICSSQQRFRYNEGVFQFRTTYVSCAIKRQKRWNMLYPAACCHIWDSIRLWCDIPSGMLLSAEDLTSLGLFRGCPPHSRIRWQAMIIVTAYAIWKGRNRFVMQKRTWSSLQIVSEIQMQSFLWLQCRGCKLLPPWDVWLINPLRNSH